MSTEHESRRKIRRKIIVKFLVFTLGVFLNFAGYLVLLSLQSSINIEDGAGAASVTATYITAALFGITFTPIMLRQFGAKICAIVCEITYLVYILINYYPAYFTLIPAGIIVGVGEATMWPVMMLFCVHFARCYSKHASKSSQFYITEFIGAFYLLFQFSAVFGNLLNYAILYGGKTPISPEHDNDNATMVTPTGRDLSVCGRNDCQDPNVTDQNLNRYEPASETLVYILIGVTAGLVVIAILIQIFLVKKIDSFKEEREDESFVSEKETSTSSEKQSLLGSMLTTIKATFFHLIKLKQLLITPFALYSGLVIYFGLGEITRAYGSCMLGVEQVGLLAALTGGADGFASYVSCKISSRVGRNVTLLIGFLVDIGYYMICLFWVATEDSLWVVYVIFIGVGLSDGIWQPLVNDLHSAYFPDELDIALTVWNMYVIVGLAWQAGWSTSLCVSTKIYFQIGFLCFSIICYVISQKIYYGKKSLSHLEEKEALSGTKL